MQVLLCLKLSPLPYIPPQVMLNAGYELYKHWSWASLTIKIRRDVKLCVLSNRKKQKWMRPKYKRPKLIWKYSYGTLVFIRASAFIDEYCIRGFILIGSVLRQVYTIEDILSVIQLSAAIGKSLGTEVRFTL